MDASAVVSTDGKLMIRIYSQNDKENEFLKV